MGIKRDGQMATAHSVIIHQAGTRNKYLPDQMLRKCYKSKGSIVNNANNKPVKVKLSMNKMVSSSNFFIPSSPPLHAC